MKEKAEMIIREAIAEIAVLGLKHNGGTLDYIANLEIGAKLFSEAISGAQETYYQEEVDRLKAKNVIYADDTDEGFQNGR